jgi:hypothetical protein
LGTDAEEVEMAEDKGSATEKTPKQVQYSPPPCGHPRWSGIEFVYLSDHKVRADATQRCVLCGYVRVIE